MSILRIKPQNYRWSSISFGDYGLWSGLVWSGRAMDPTKGNTTAISSFTTGGPSLELTYLRRFVLVEQDLRLSQVEHLFAL
ncbi:hypothetical protein V501_05001 [Pseudogymnoascus sp. VKM F-4519 (FW-2642)]|nr:hypothetical protein V501_05001 [Pseudogymnoascus sp. VKM F-4519 (FW-2642)]